MEAMLDPGTARKLINPHMPVVGSSGAPFATVDHLEGSDMIKLTRDESGQHHYIPLEWVTSVDEEVHIDRPREQAMKEWSTDAASTEDAAPTEDAASTEDATPTERSTSSSTNSVEEMRGQPLAVRVEARVAELEQALAGLAPEETIMRREIEQSLAAVASMTTGDISHPPDAVAAQLSDWLERNRHLGLVADPAAAEPAPADREA
jgi:hypothetical protein